MKKRTKSNPLREGAISTGCTLLNLAIADHPGYGFLKGGYYYVVGDSTSGKTWVTLSCFAEACRSGHFKDYRLVFDDVEGGALMNIEHYFGKEVARRMEPPSRDKDGSPVYSDTVESFYYHISDLQKDGRPFIYVLDSQDALTSDASSKKFNEQKKAAEAEKETSGSYGDGKAKYHSQHLPHVLSKLRSQDSILIVIGQTRDNLGMGFEKKTRSGGKALRFYANIEIWTSVKGQIKKTIRGRQREIGVNCEAFIKKNRITGKVGRNRSIIMPIYHDLGIDDVGSCVDYLIDEGHWDKATGKKHVYDAKELLFEGTRDRIITYVEEEGLEHKIRVLVGRLWKDIEAECKPNRKRRYE